MALIQGWHLFKIQSISGKQEYGNGLSELKAKETCFSACLKSIFLYCSQFHNLHVNTTAIHNMNKDLMSDVHSQLWNWYIKKDLCLAY